MKEFKILCWNIKNTTTDDNDFNYLDDLNTGNITFNGNPLISDAPGTFYNEISRYSYPDQRVAHRIEMQSMSFRLNTEPIVHIASQMAALTIKPIDTAKYECKQSNYACCPELPMRAMLCGPSGCGKSVVLQNMILDVFRGCFSRVYIFSPSIDIDQTWDPVKNI